MSWLEEGLGNCVMDFLKVTSISCYSGGEDFRLAWDPEDYGGVDRVYLPTKKVWVPDVDLYNG